MSIDCPICDLHRNEDQRIRYEIYRDDLWVLRHHPEPAPLVGWLLLDSLRHCPGPIDFSSKEANDWGLLLLDSLRHCPGPIDFSSKEANDWGLAVHEASVLVQKITQCDRVYSIAFGEGAQHLHLHLIPRFISNPATKAWSVADHYRSIDSGKLEPVSRESINQFVAKARCLGRSGL